MHRSYPSKGPSLIPSTVPNIFPKQQPSAKPQIIKSFILYDIMTYVTFVYPIKYPKLVPRNVPLIVSLWYSISNYFWMLFHTIQLTTSTNTKTFHYIIFFQYLLLVFNVLNIYKREIRIGHSPWFQYVPINSLVLQIMVQYRLSLILWNRISNKKLDKQE